MLVIEEPSLTRSFRCLLPPIPTPVLLDVLDIFILFSSGITPVFLTVDPHFPNRLARAMFRPDQADFRLWKPRSTGKICPVIPPWTVDGAIKPRILRFDSVCPR